MFKITCLRCGGDSVNVDKSVDGVYIQCNNPECEHLVEYTYVEALDDSTVPTELN